MCCSKFVTFVVDDERAILRSLSRLLNAKGYEVRAYECAEEFLEHHDPVVPGCAIVDISMPGLNGLELQRTLSEGHVERPLIFLSGAADVPTSVQAMKAGAIDFLTKPFRSADLLGAIEKACSRFVSVREKEAQVGDVVSRLSRLTPRERQVLAGVVAGRLNKQIAGDLGISVKTTKMHRGSMMRKMQVRAVADLVRLVALTGADTSRPVLN